MNKQLKIPTGFLGIFIVIFTFILAWVIFYNHQLSTNKTSERITVRDLPSFETPIPHQQKQQEEYSFTIRITDDEGELLERAQVSMNDDNHLAIKQGMSNIDGIISFHNMPVGKYTISASHDRCFEYQNIPFEVTHKMEDVFQIILPRKKQVAGLVVNASGDAIEGVTIQIHSARVKWDMEENWKEKITQSTSEGRFEMSPLVAGEYILYASHRAYLPHYEPCKAGETDLIVTLKQDVRVIVHVVDDQKMPVGGASVKIRSATGSDGLSILEEITRRDGKVEFHDLKPSWYSIHAQLPFSSISSATDIDATQQDEIEIVLTCIPARFSISGKVLNEINQRAIQSATVVCQVNEYRLIHNKPLQCITNEFGKFSFNDLPVGMYTIHVDELPGYLSGNHSEYQWYGTSSPRTISQYVERDIDNLILYLSPSWFIQGTVFGSDNRPLPETELQMEIVYHPSVRGEGAGRKAIGKTVLSQENGAYEIEGNFHVDHNDSSVVILASHPDYRPSSSDSIKPAPGTIYQDIDFYLKGNKEPNLRGNIVDTDGNPVANATVVLWDTMQQRGQEITDILTTIQSDHEGKYSGYVEQYGSHYCVAQAKGYTGIIEPGKDQVEIKKDTITTKDFVLKTANLTISGYVVDSFENPLSDVEIYVSRYEKARRAIDLYDGILCDTTGSDGAFQCDLTGISGYATNPVYKITALPRNNSPYAKAVKTNVEEGESNLKIVMDKKSDLFADIYGFVIDSQNQPVSEFDAILLPSFNKIFERGGSTQHLWQHFYSSNGQFHFEDVIPENSPYRVTVKDNNNQFSISQPIHLIEGQVVRDVVIQIRDGIDITGKIIDQSTNQPVSGVQISFQIMTDTFQQNNVFHDRGTSRLLLLGHFAPEQSRIIPRLPEGKTSENGEFSINNVPNFPLWALFQCSGYRPLIQPVIPTNRKELNLGVLYIESANRR